MLWFVSGMVMMYWSFPEVSAEDRLQRAAALNPGRIRLSAEEAHAILGRDEPPAQVRLTTFDGRPVYRIAVGRDARGGGGGTAMVYADDGTEQLVVDHAMIDRAAANWTGLSLGSATRESIEEVDQWTVAGLLRAGLSLYKYSWPDGQQVYVNGETAEIVQYTTTRSRLWAYLGAIPHWLYFTPLRKHSAEWSSFVVWSALIGTVTALMGVVIGVWMYSPRKRYRQVGKPTSIPYRGWKRWHAIIGLFFGVVTTTWAFSGLLSMGPFPIVNRLTELTIRSDAPRGDGASTSNNRGVNVATALRGSRRLELSSYTEKHPATAIAALGDFEAKELQYTSFAGEPVYLASNGRGETRVIPMRGEVKATFELDDVMRVVREAVGNGLAELRVLEGYDAYYLDRRGERPLPVIYARMNDAVSSRYYIDPKTARVVGSYSARNWVSRWLYHGLHSLDFPWLYKHRPLWDIVVLVLMLGGTALSATSIVMTWRVLARKLAAVVRRRYEVPDEDLAIDV